MDLFKSLVRLFIMCGLNIMKVKVEITILMENCLIIYSSFNTDK